MRYFCRAIIVMAIAVGLFVILGLPLWLLAQMLESWWEAVGGVVAIFVFVGGLIAFLAWAQKKAGW